MPIDASIPLQVKPFELADPMDSFGKALQLRNLVQQGQTHAAQLQGYNLENQQRSTAIEGQKALANSVSKYSTPNQDGTVSIDEGAVSRDVFAQGYYDVGRKFQADQRAARTEALNNHDKELTVNEKKLQQIGGLLQTVKTAPPEEQSNAYKIALNTAVGLKLIKPGDPAIPPEWNPATTPAWLDQRINDGLGLQKSMDEHRKDKEYQLQLDKRADERAAAAPVTAAHWSKIMNDDLATADSLDHYGMGISNLERLGIPLNHLATRPGVVIATDATGKPHATLDPAFQWTPDVQEALRKDALTEEQRETQARLTETAEWNKTYREDSLAQRKQIAGATLALGQDRLDARRDLSVQTGNSRRIATSQALKRYDAATDEEAGLNQLSTRLANALASDKSYVNDKGVLVSMTKAVFDSGGDIADLRQDMQGRLAQTRKQLHAAVDAKFDVTDEYGDPNHPGTYTRQQVHDAYNGKPLPSKAQTDADAKAKTDADAKAKGGTPPPPAPPKPAQGSAAPKVGEVRSKGGRSYKFDGRQWNLQ